MEASGSRLIGDMSFKRAARRYNVVKKVKTSHRKKETKSKL
jgi:hypothetical protein